MATVVSPGNRESAADDRGFAVWPAGVAGLAIAVGLLAIGANVPGQSEGFRRAFGGMMALAQGMAAFATVAMIGQALRIAGAERPLAELRRRLAEDRDSGLPPRGPGARRAFGSEIERYARELSDRQEASRRISRFVAAVVPGIGFVVATGYADARDSWAAAGQPLFLGLGEAFFVLLLHLGVSNSAEVLKAGWIGLSPKVAAPAVPDDPLDPGAFVDQLAAL